MKLSEKQIKFSRMIGWFLCELGKRKINVTLGEAHRTEYQQKRYVKLGKSKTLLSKHRDRLALDLNLRINGKYVRKAEPYRILGMIWESIGGCWGGRFGVKEKDYETKIGWDANHFEYKD